MIETIIASVIIVLVFSMAILILHAVFKHKISNNTSHLNNHIYELEYRIQHKNIVIPYQETFENWEITIQQVQENLSPWIVCKAEHVKTKKIVLKKKVYVAE